MRFGFVGVMGVFACLLVFQMAGAQSPGPYHKLTAEEFYGVPEIANNDVVAHTNCFIDFQYRAQSDRNGVYHLTSDIKLVFNNKKSWIDRKQVLSPAHLEQILNHEQGHYTLAYLEQQELIRAVNKTRFDANYDHEAASLFDRVHEKYKQLSLDYDDDTDHMRNHQQQHSWDEYFKKQLAYKPVGDIVWR